MNESIDWLTPSFPLVTFFLTPSFPLVTFFWISVHANTTTTAIPLHWFFTINFRLWSVSGEPTIRPWDGCQLLNIAALHLIDKLRNIMMGGGLDTSSWRHQISTLSWYQRSWNKSDEEWFVCSSMTNLLSLRSKTIQTEICTLRELQSSPLHESDWHRRHEIQINTAKKQHEDHGNYFKWFRNI